MKVPLEQYEFPKNKIANVQSQLERLIEKNYYLHQSAKDGYRSYLQAYASYSLKEIFNVNHLDLVKLAKAFGFKVPPKVNITIGSAVMKEKRRDTGKQFEGNKLNGKEHFMKQRNSAMDKDIAGRQWSR